MTKHISKKAVEEFLNCLADLGLKLYRAGIDIEDLEKHLEKTRKKKAKICPKRKDKECLKKNK